MERGGQGVCPPIVHNWNPTMITPNPDKILYGKMTHKHYEEAWLADLPNKTVEAVYQSQVASNYQTEPMTFLLFTDGTCHGFVHPPQDDD